MPFVGLTPEKARDLSTVMKAGAATADGLGSEVTAALTLSGLESDVPARLVSTGDELDQVAVVISARADIAEGFVVDPARLAADLGITLAQADAAIAAFDEAADGNTAGITPIMDVLVANRQSTEILRATLVTLPEQGQDIELDQALVRMGSWLLEALETGELPPDLDATQVADLSLLNRFLNPNADVPIAVGALLGGFGVVGAEGIGFETLSPEALQNIAESVFGDVAKIYELDSRLNSAAGLPLIEDMVVAYQRAHDVSFDMPAEWAALNDWLPAYLAGEGPASTDPDQLAMAVAFARATGWNGGAQAPGSPGAIGPFASGIAGAAFLLGDRLSTIGSADGVDAAQVEAALAHLKNGRFLQKSLIPGEFEDFDSPLIPITELGLGSAIAAGQRRGVLTEEGRRQVEAYAEQIIGGDVPVAELSEDQQQALIAAVIGQNGEAFVIDDPNIQRQLVAAINLIARQETADAQRKLFADTIEAFRSLAVVGAPAMTFRQIEAAIGPEAAEELSYKDLSARSSERVGKRPFYLSLLAQWGIPGSDKIKTKKRKFKFEFDESGELISIKKKKISRWKRFKNTLKAFGKAWLQSWKDNPWKALFDTAKIAASVVASVFPATSAAGIAAISVLAADTAVSIADGDVLGALSSAFGAVGGAAGYFGDAAEMVSTGAKLGKNVVDGIEATDNLIDAIDDGNILGAIGSGFGLLGNAANIVSSGAEFANQVSGVVADSALLATDTLNTIVNTGSEVAKTAGQLQNITSGVGITIDAVEDGDIGRAILGGVAVVGQGIQAATDDAGIIDDGLRLAEGFEGNLAQVGTSLVDVGQAGLTGIDTIEAIENDDLVGALSNGFRFAGDAANIVGNANGAVGGLVGIDGETSKRLTNFATTGSRQLAEATELGGAVADADILRIVENSIDLGQLSAQEKSRLAGQLKAADSVLDVAKVVESVYDGAPVDLDRLYDEIGEAITDVGAIPEAPEPQPAPAPVAATDIVGVTADGRTIVRLPDGREATIDLASADRGVTADGQVIDLGNVDGRFGDDTTGAGGATLETGQYALDQLTPGRLAIRAKELSDVAGGHVIPDPESRLGAFAGTLGYEPGTVGHAVNRAIGTLYELAGSYGEENVGRVFNSPEAQELFDQPVDGPAGRRLAELEHRYWENVAEEDPFSPGGNLGAIFDPDARDFLQRNIFANFP